MELQSHQSKGFNFKDFLSSAQIELGETREEISKIQKILRGGEIVRGEEVFTKRIKFLMDKETEIKKALENVDKNLYGICQTCRESISPRRLKVFPFANQCALCASKNS